MRTYQSLRGFFVILVLALAVPTVAPAQVLIKDSPDFLKVFQPVVAEPSKSTVEIQCEGKKVALGTVVKSDGLIMTLASELEGSPTVKLPDGRKFEASVVGQNRQFNLVLLKIEAYDLPAVTWRPSKEAAVGSWAISPGTGKNPAAVGVISVPMRKMNGPKNGPQEAPDQGYMGVNLANTAKEVRVEEVVKGSGAAKGGIKKGDVIVGIEGKEVTDGVSLKKIMQGFKKGTTVEVKVQRGDEVAILKIKLGPRPESRNEIQNNMGSKLSKVKTGFPVILQHDSIIRPDDCGGPLVDLDGKTIGINVCRAGRTESYAIPTEAVMPLIDEMIAGKHPPKSGNGDKTGTSSK
jgi:serine protease Do